MNCFDVFFSKSSLLLALLIFTALSSGCGSQGETGGSSSSKTTPITISDIANQGVTYQIAGSVQGLDPNTSVSLANAKETITVTADVTGKASFVFQTRVPALGAYEITIVPGSTPAGMSCSLGADASGTGINKDVTSATIACSKFTYVVGGQVSGLDAGLQLVLKEPSNSPLTISTNGSFSFPVQLAYNSEVSVSVLAQPSGNICSVNIPTTTVTNTVSNIVVTCAKRSFRVSGTVTGLTLGQSVTLRNNGSDAQTVTYSASGPSSFSFASPIAFSSPYTVSVGTQPASQKCVISNAAGTMGAADVSNVLVQCADPVYTVSTFVNEAAFSSRVSDLGPTDLGVDSADNIYAVFKYDNKIKKITPAGTVTNFAGSGSYGAVNGPATSASFSRPSGIVFDKHGNAYVADTNGYRIRKIDTSGVVSTLTGNGNCGTADGDLASATFCGDSAIAMDANGNLYTGDNFHELSSVRKINLTTRTVSTLAGNSELLKSGGKGYVDGVGANARFYGIAGIALDTSGNLFIADTANKAIRKVSTNGETTTFAGKGPNSVGDADGVGVQAIFGSAYAIAIDTSGNLFVADYASKKIKRITPYGVVTTIAGSGASDSIDGVGTNAAFKYISGITIDSKGNIYVSDSGAINIRKLTPN